MPKGVADLAGSKYFFFKLIIFVNFRDIIESRCFFFLQRAITSRVFVDLNTSIQIFLFRPNLRIIAEL